MLDVRTLRNKRNTRKRSGRDESCQDPSLRAERSSNSLGGLLIELLMSFNRRLRRCFWPRFSCRAPLDAHMVVNHALTMRSGGGPQETELADGTPVEYLGYKFSEPRPHITGSFGFGIETDRFFSNPFASRHG